MIFITFSFSEVPFKINKLKFLLLLTNAILPFEDISRRVKKKTNKNNSKRKEN